MIEHLFAPAIDRETMMEIEPTIICLIDDIRDYIEDDVTPEDRNLVGILQKRAARYSVLDGVLYRSRVMPLLRCIRPEELKEILAEIHHGVCGGHPGARMLASKVLLCGYY